MTTPAEAARVLAKCGATDPKFPKPDAVMAVAWAEIFDGLDLDLSDLLEAVRLHYRESPERAMPATLIRIARELRRSRAPRETMAAIHAEAQALPPGAASKAEHRASVIADFASRVGRKKSVPPLYRDASGQ